MLEDMDREVENLVHHFNKIPVIKIAAYSIAGMAFLYLLFLGN